MPYSLETKTIIDTRWYPRFTISKLTSECRGRGEEVCARNIVPQDYYFVENGEESPLINDFASTDGSGNKIVDHSPFEPSGATNNSNSSITPVPVHP